LNDALLRRPAAAHGKKPAAVGRLDDGSVEKARRAFRNAAG
jgi:hypothetical protein